MTKLTSIFVSFITLLLLFAATNCSAQNPSWMYWDPWNSLIPSRILPDMDIDANGLRWIATEPVCGGGICTDGGLASFNGTTFTVYDSLNSTLNSNFIGAVHIDAENTVWAGTGHGEVSSFTGNNWMAHPFPTKNNVPITDISSDLYGYIWASTGGNGIYMFDMSQWTHYFSGNSIIGNYISSVKVGPDNSVWCGGAGSKLYTFTDSWSELQLPDDVYFTSTMAIDHENRVWVGSDGIFSNYHGGSWIVCDENVTGIPDSSIGYVFDICFDNSGNTWIGHSEGLIKFDGTEWSTYLPSNSGLLSRHIMSLVADELGNLWIGTSDTGLIAYNEGGIVSIKKLESGIRDHFDISSYPNPFSSSINLSYTLAEPVYLRLTVIDLMGRQLRILHDGPQSAGEKRSSWDGTTESGEESPPGIYLLSIQIDGQHHAHRLIKH